MLGSKIEATLRAAGHEVELGAEPGEGADLLIADLNRVDPAGVAGSGVPVLGYYSHVDVDVRRAAKEAGVDLVVPRSRLARELPELVERLLG